MYNYESKASAFSTSEIYMSSYSAHIRPNIMSVAIVLNRVRGFFVYNLSRIETRYKKDIAPQIPLTRQFKKRVRNNIYNCANRGITDFLELKSIDQQSKDELISYARHYENQLAVNSFYTNFEYYDLLRSFIFFLSIFLSFLLPLILRYWIYIPMSIIEWLLYGYFSAISGSVITLLILTPVISIIGLFRFLPYTIKIVLWLTPLFLALYLDLYFASLLVSLVSSSNNVNALSIYRIALIIISVIPCFLTFIFILLIDLYFDKVFEKRFLYSHLDAIIYRELKAILRLSEREHSSWNSFKNKRIVLRRLEYLASITSLQLPRYLKSGDPATDAWFNHRSKKVACAFRELKKWILVPMPDTQEQFGTWIAECLVCVLRGNTDRMPQAEPTNSLQRQWVMNTFNVVRIAISSLLPLGTFMTFQLTPFALGKPTSDYVFAAAFIWIMLSILNRLDPLMSEKVGTLESISKLLPIPEIKKGKII